MPGGLVPIGDWTNNQYRLIAPLGISLVSLQHNRRYTVLSAKNWLGTPVMTMNPEAFFIPDIRTCGEGIRLSRSISAIQLLPKEGGGAKLGLVAQLSPGTTVQRCGDGFNERTTKVHAQGQYYFVFLQDIESQALIARN
jgi:hypothetical protein